jgi:hypothetical protein
MTIFITVILLQLFFNFFANFSFDPESIGNFSSITSLIALICAILLYIVLVTVFVLIDAARWVWILFRRPVGSGRISETRFESLVDGLESQSAWLELHSSFPRHMPTAKMARHPSLVHFGDARYSVSWEKRAEISSFLGRPGVKHGADALDKCLLVVTGEPGAGKSVLTQEIQHSLVQGIRARRHSLVPLVVFASNLTTELLESDDLQYILSTYFRQSMNKTEK